MSLSAYSLIDIMDDTTKVFAASGQWNDMQPHLLVLYTLARYCTAPPYGEARPQKPPLVLEIGVRQGVSTLALLLGLKHAGGHLISLDVDPVETEVAKQVVADAGLADRWTFHLTHSDEFAPTCPAPLDLLWIDGDHNTPQPQKDFNNYAPKVRKGGIIAMHDYFVEPWRVEERGAQMCVEAVKRTGQYEVCVLPYGFGFTIMRKLV